MEQPRRGRRYTYADYCTWDDDKRWELIDGVAYMMSAPGTRHQRVVGEIHRQLANFLRGKPCDVFASPFDVRLDGADEDDSVVQPDILVVCDKSKIDEKGVRGAPDFMVEVLSPATSRYDRVIKFNLYQRAGVREYWIADPDSGTVGVFLLEGGKYIAAAYSAADTAPVEVLPGCEIDLREVFNEE